MKLLRELLQEQEDNKMFAVVYAGRFQPFHRCHAAVYSHLCKLFGKNKVWIATSNKVNMDPSKGDVSPLTFDERKEVMIRMFGIDPEHVVQCKNPAFSPIEVLSLYKGPTVCVIAVGKKDEDRYKESKFFEPYPMEHGEPMDFKKVRKQLEDTSQAPKMYYLVMKDQAGSMSGTKARELISKLDTETTLAERKATFKKVFGNYDEMIYELLVGKISQVKDEHA